MTMRRIRFAVLAAISCLVLAAQACSQSDKLSAAPASAALEANDTTSITTDATAATATIDSTSSGAESFGGGNSNNWPAAGHDLVNTRSQPNEHHIDRNSAKTLTPKWIFQTDGDVWATPAVVDNALYVPDAAGNLFAIQRKTGALIWRHAISDYTGLANDISRTTPAVVGDLLIMGDQGGRQATLAGARVFAVRRNSGELAWVTKVEDHASAVITQSPVVYQDTVYVGVSSIEETYAASTPAYPCCSFRGSMLALNKRDGSIRWKTYMTPGSEAPGFAGAAVWGSTPVIDSRRNAVYIATGNNYVVPKEILECQMLSSPDAVQSCVASVPGSADDHFDSIVSLDLRSGAIKWVRAMVPFDSWNVSCIFRVPGNEGNCTSPHGEDFDFGQGPTLFEVRSQSNQAQSQSQAQNSGERYHGSRQLLGAGQKSGKYWAVNPDDGSVVWSTQVGPGGSLGGMEWGSATDGTRIYSAIANVLGQPWTLSDGTMTTSGFWSAIDAATGKILWQTAGTPVVKSSNQGAVSVANGVVYAGTVDTAGTMYALDAANGATLWTFASGGSVNSGASIVDGTVYWGSGYGVRGIGLRANNKLYAFVPQADCKKNNSNCVPIAGAGGASGSGGAGGSTGAAGSGGPIPTTWSGIFSAYFTPGTIGHCTGCHNGSGRIVPLTNAAEAYTSLQSVGQINGTSSPIGSFGLSRLSWLGGDMPPNGPSIASDAETIRAWVASGAPNN